MKIEEKLKLIGLDAPARAMLGTYGAVVAEGLPAVLDAFYRDMLEYPHLKTFFADEAAVAHAQGAQLRHWEVILKADFSDAYLQSARRIGEAHHRIGLQPCDYISGYAKVLAGLHQEIEKRMAGGRKGRDRRALQDAVTRAAMLDMELALTVYITRVNDDQHQIALNEICEVLEADVDSAVAEVMSMSDDSTVRGEKAASNASQIAIDASAVATSSEEVRNSVNAVSNATEALSQAGQEIAQRAAETARYASKAVEEVENASNTVSALNESANRIGSVVTVIAEVASQTNLLALNATIEAARAGEVGKGFAVVAHEVKALARKTADAAEDIARRVADIQSAAADGVSFIGKIGTEVSGINEASVSVAAAAEEQEITLKDVVRSLREGSEGVAAVAQNISSISDRSSKIESESRLVSRLVRTTNGRLSDLRANLVMSLRQVRARGYADMDYRRPVAVPAKIRRGPHVIAGTVLELSEHALRFRADTAGLAMPEGEEIVIAMDRIGEFPACAIAIGDTAVHVAFPHLAGADRRRLDDYLRGIDASDKAMIDAVMAAGHKIEAAFESAIKSGAISEASLFDFTYRRIPGTDPEQFEAPFTALCDRVLPEMQEPMLTLDPRVVFCAAVDRNAYLPTHNMKYSLPQRSDDPVWNAANSRNRRFFKDRAGLTASRTTRKFAVQSYDRNMGGGTIVTLKEIDVPITVRDKHWGGLRFAFKA